MRKIKKNITVTTISAAIIKGINGNIERTDIAETVTTFDNVTDENAVKKFMQNVSNPAEYKGKIVIVTDIKRESLTFTMDVETFMKYATVEEVNDADEFKATEDGGNE